MSRASPLSHVTESRRLASSPVEACLRRLAHHLKHASAILKDWRRAYEQRRQLLVLPDYLLKDIGLSPYDACKEARKPFWKK